MAFCCLSLHEVKLIIMSLIWKVQATTIVCSNLVSEFGLLVLEIDWKVPSSRKRLLALPSQERSDLIKNVLLRMTIEVHQVRAFLPLSTYLNEDSFKKQAYIVERCYNNTFTNIIKWYKHILTTAAI